MAGRIKNSFKKTILSVKRFGIQIRTDRMLVLIWVQTVGPDLGPNCLQRLSADN